MCERELCVFAFQTLGVMNEAADEIATGAQVLIHDTNYFIFGFENIIYSALLWGQIFDSFLIH